METPLVESARRLAWAGKIITDKSMDGFFGNITVYMENGRVVRIEVKESLLPPQIAKPK